MKLAYAIAAISGQYPRINPAADDDEQAVKIRMVALECITFAAIQRALRKSRFDDSAEFMDYFRLELYGDWTGLIATSKGIAGLILDVDRDENSDYDEDDRSSLKRFLSLSGICGKGTGGNVSDWRLKTECITATIHFCIQ